MSSKCQCGHDYRAPACGGAFEDDQRVPVPKCVKILGQILSVECCCAQSSRQESRSTRLGIASNAQCGRLKEASPTHTDQCSLVLTYKSLAKVGGSGGFSFLSDPNYIFFTISSLHLACIAGATAFQSSPTRIPFSREKLPRSFQPSRITASDLSMNTHRISTVPVTDLRVQWQRASPVKFPHELPAHLVACTFPSHSMYASLMRLAIFTTAGCCRRIWRCLLRNQD